MKYSGVGKSAGSRGYRRTSLWEAAPERLAFLSIHDERFDIFKPSFDLESAR